MRFLYTSFIILFISNSIFSEDLLPTFTGILYREGTTELIYTQKEFKEKSKEESKIWHNFYDKSGELKASETAKLNNNSLYSYDLELKDLDFKGNIIFNSDDLVMTRYSKDSIKSKTFKVGKDILVGPLLPQYIKNNFKAIKSGEAIYFYLPFFDMLTFVEMKIKSIETNASSTTIEMKLKNPLLSFLISSVFMELDSEGTIKEIHGPTILPDPETPGSKKTINTDIIYKYGDEQ